MALHGSLHLVVHHPLQLQLTVWIIVHLKLVPAAHSTHSLPTQQSVP